MNSVDIPHDLQHFLAGKSFPYDTSVTESPAAKVQRKRISNTMMGYFPDIVGKPVGIYVVFHVPGGFGAVHDDADQSWLSNKAKELGCICILHQRDALNIGNGRFDQVMSECMCDFETIVNLVAAEWKEQHGTSEKRIIVSGSSVGATIALALVSTMKTFVCMLVALVPLVDTNPDLKKDPWGPITYSPGLTPDRLLENLDAVFKDDKSRNDWRKNPSNWHESRLTGFPPTVFVFARYDILCYPGYRFMERMIRRGVDCSHLVVDGIHQAKDMDRVTQAGRDIRQFVMKMCSLRKEPPISSGLE